MTPTLPDRHLRLILNDDLTLEAASGRAFGVWRAVLGQEARRGPAPRVLIAAHGGLVSRAAGEAFAEHVRELYGEHWTVTLVTRTGLDEALDRLTNTHLFSGLVAALGQLAALYRRVDPGALFPAESSAPALAPPEGSPALRPLDREREARLLARLGALARPVGAGVEGLAGSGLDDPGDFRAAARDAARRVNLRLGAHTWRAVGPGLPGRLLPFPGRQAPLTAPEVRAALAPVAVAAADPGALQAYVVEEVIRTLFPPPRLLWSAMKDRMAALLAPGAVGTEVLAFLNGLPDLHLSLLGHSLGGLLLDHLQRRAVTLSPLQGRLVRVVYLAPANTLAFARRTPRPARAELALMGLTDAEERTEVGQVAPLLAGLYPRTLLYLIRGALEEGRDTPLLGMQRDLTADPLERRFAAVTWVPTPDLRHFTHGGFLSTPAVRAWVRARLG